MSTTNLFVELIVIGVGAALWVVLLVLSVFGYDWIPLDSVLSLPALIPVLSIIYVLGIVSDRLADAVFERIWKPTLYRKFFGGNNTDFDDRRLIYVRSERLADLLEYGRSRLRICRGWAFNCVGILICLILFAATRIPTSVLQMQVIIVGSVLLLALIVALWFSWRQLVITDYRKVRDQAAFLRQIDDEKNSDTQPPLPEPAKAPSPNKPAIPTGK